MICLKIMCYVLLFVSFVLSCYTCYAPGLFEEWYDSQANVHRARGIGPWHVSWVAYAAQRRTLDVASYYVATPETVWWDQLNQENACDPPEVRSLWGAGTVCDPTGKFVGVPTHVRVMAGLLVSTLVFTLLGLIASCMSLSHHFFTRKTPEKRRRRYLLVLSECVVGFSFLAMIFSLVVLVYYRYDWPFGVLASKKNVPWPVWDVANGTLVLVSTRSVYGGTSAYISQIWVMSAMFVTSAASCASASRPYYGKLVVEEEEENGRGDSLTTEDFSARVEMA